MNFIESCFSYLGITDSFKVSEVDIFSVQRWERLACNGMFTLYKDGHVYSGILAVSSSGQKAFSLFKLHNERDARRAYECLGVKLQTLFRASSRPLEAGVIKKISDVIREHQTFSCAHIASYLGLFDLLWHERVSASINEVDLLTQKTPLHVAVEAGNLDCVGTLLRLGARLDRINAEGRTALHLAAGFENHDILKLLVSKGKSFINHMDHNGETLLHAACLGGFPKNLETLLKNGGDPTITRSSRYPVHCAVASDSISCMKVLSSRDCELIHKKDKHSGDSVLHLAASKEMMHVLVNLGCSTEVRNSMGSTPLLSRVEQGDLSMAIGLLTLGADITAMDELRNSALHLAIKKDRADITQLLLVFGADVDQSNGAGDSPRHLASCLVGMSNRDEILHYLHLAGASRCTVRKQRNCSDGCRHDGNFDGRPKSNLSQELSNIIESYVDGPCRQTSFDATLLRPESPYGDEENSRHQRKPGDRVLCLDGGGIRGLVTIKILMALEHIIGQPIHKSFNWIGGTSTGGILTMGLLQGKGLKYMLGAYFRMKDSVFQGERPYSSEALEKFLKKELGEQTTMTHIQKPRVMLMSVLVDRFPAELFVFRNYEIPGVEHDPRPSQFRKFPPIPRPQDQPIWQALRSTSAAPTYFRPCGRFVDGGLIANNPTLDVLVEVDKFNSAGRKQNSQDVAPMRVVVSVGTGKIPQKFVENVEVFSPQGFLDLIPAALGVSNFVKLLVSQATQTEGQQVSRAATWCNMIDVPYFRLNPQLSQDIPLDCTDDSVLVNMLWETQCYLQKNHEKLVQLANLIRV